MKNYKFRKTKIAEQQQHSSGATVAIEQNNSRGMQQGHSSIWSADTPTAGACNRSNKAECLSHQWPTYKQSKKKEISIQRIRYQALRNKMGEKAHISTSLCDVGYVTEAKGVDHRGGHAIARVSSVDDSAEWSMAPPIGPPDLVAKKLSGVPFSGFCGIDAGLDKAYATSSWFHEYPDTAVIHHPILFLDHAAIILSDSAEDNKVRRPYRIENWCLSAKDVHTIVDSVVSLIVAGSPMFSLSWNLSFIKDRLLVWCTSHKRLWGIDWKNLALSIGQAASSLHTRSCRRRNKIHSLKSLDGSWVTDPIGIKSVVLSFYQHLYTVQGSSLVTESSCIDDNKTPGPDGFSLACFKIHWQLVGPSVVGAVQDFFTHGYMLKKWNQCFCSGTSCVRQCSNYPLSFMNASRAKKRYYVALKLDMNKAYDRVRWEFLLHGLQVLVNGDPSSTFLPQCGLRQGDPLSSYLFVPCMEVLPAILRSAEKQSLLKGICISRGAPSISYLFLADDSLLFFQVSPSTCDNLMGLLSDFCDYRDYLARSLRLQCGDSLDSYLGLPVDLGRSKVSEFRFLVDKVPKRLSDFASLRLSSAAKLVIINPVLVASFNYILSVFQIPSSICQHVDRMLACFWWRSSSSSRGITVRSSSLLHLPKGLGGLGLRSL
ncbi:uncharacterized protein LOC110716070 [Chenopodium quinoa]|uniref:uncharacterized protein LOC110716070 n=1 Tax=Chenopodium quinoa TaxID=63459 RepID=UPI000B787011|nr:uncharacterized protein LOC110716070 [Chenopodium quinoa]